jgi:uncharacterized protein
MKNLSEKFMPKSSFNQKEIEQICTNVWMKISPNWPLQNLIACNPLQGFENMKFENALKQGLKFFQQKDFPKKLEIVNQITIKWCQVFFDQGQATIKMPNRHMGFYQAWKNMAEFDEQIHNSQQEKILQLKNLSQNSKATIHYFLEQLLVKEKDKEEFLIILLTTLSGWSSYVKYLGEWSYEKNAEIELDYLAVRLAITSIIWPEAGKELLDWNKKLLSENYLKEKMQEITVNEAKHSKQLLKTINLDATTSNKTADAQLVFCIDVRSEPFRRALEQCGNYETFGFAGFFGIPTKITNQLTGESHSSCPVLLSPKHNVAEVSMCSHQAKTKQIKSYSTLLEIKKFYQALKYNFTTPLPLAEGMGIWSGGWMMIKTFSPKSKKFLQKTVKKTLKQNFETAPEIEAIPFEDQCAYAAGALRAIGLIQNFAEIVVFCGHGSQTENNSFATSLDCGACGGRHGDSNAKILAAILNQPKVRNRLKSDAILIPTATKFIAAKHNTTTDEVEIYPQGDRKLENLVKLEKSLTKAQKINNEFRAKKMGFVGKQNQLQNFFFNRSHSWSEVQPEWALAQNASFIVAPRSITKNANLDGRSFLHSYDWNLDEDGAILNLILNAPMVVAQWINSQYLFSTIDNVAFGSGSKITQNIVGKIGVMQGNSSDLMHGLALQSVYANDYESYHKPSRLITLVYAPSNKIDNVIAKSPKLQQLFANQWVGLYCLDPRSKKFYRLRNDLTWSDV